MQQSLELDYWPASVSLFKLFQQFVTIFFELWNNATDTVHGLASMLLAHALSCSTEREKLRGKVDDSHRLELVVIFQSSKEMVPNC